MAAAAVLPGELDRRVSEFISRTHKMLIGGKWVNSASGKTFPTYDPATGKVLAQVAEGDKEDVNRAVMDLNEVIGVITARIAEDDVPAIEIGAVEEHSPTLIGIWGRPAGSQGTRRDKKTAEDDAPKHFHRSISRAEI